MWWVCTKGVYTLRGHIMSCLLFKVQNINVTSKKKIKLHVLDNLHMPFSVHAMWILEMEKVSRKENKEKSKKKN